ncbi:MAG TPA: hypothetical protein VGG28_24285 [Kofleriaceae bacterium]|jgi:hypothetical protein
MSGPEQEAKPAAANAPATTDQPQRVSTHWFVDYSKLAGNLKRSPWRMGDDQLVVDELKIVPDTDKAQILHGGNAAKSGEVLLGDAMIPASTGRVSAAVRYGSRKAFRATATLDGKKTPAETKQLGAIQNEINANLDGMLEESGDYTALQSELEARYASRFPDKRFSVQVAPLSSSGSATFSAAAGSYDAHSATRFLVMIDPGEVANRETTYSKTSVEDHGQATHDNSSHTSAVEGTSQTEDTQIDEIEKTFEESMTEKIEETFLQIATAVASRTDVSEAELSKTVTWKVGVNAKEPAKPGADDKKPTKVPLYKRMLSTAKDWVLSGLGGKLFKVGKAIFDVAGDVWDVVSARGYFSRDSSDTNESKDSHSTTTSNTATDQNATVHAITQELKDTFVQRERTEVRKMIAKHLTESTTSSNGAEATNKTTSTTTISGSTATHEAGALSVTVHAKG